MPNTTYYIQECPICGRTLQIRVKYLGKQVSCQHCQADFKATDPSSLASPASDSSLALLARADDLLATAARFAGDVE